MRLFVSNNTDLDSINFDKFKRTTSSTYYNLFRVNNNGIETNCPLFEESMGLQIYSNPSLELIKMDSVSMIYNRLQINSNANLLKLDLPRLFETGSDGRDESSFRIFSNQNLSDINAPLLRKVYDNLYVINNNNLDVSHVQLPCELYVFINDSYDCNDDDFNISGNLNNSIVFKIYH